MTWNVVRSNLFQLLKIERAVSCPITQSSTMSARRRRPNATETSSSEAFNLILDPKRVLLRRLFFIDEDRTTYVSVGFYPTREYQPFVEFGSVKKIGSTILILDDWQVNKMVQCLPTICESMCGNEQYGYKESNFRMNTTRSYRTASRQYISLKLGDLQYLSRIFYVIQNQLNVYTVSLTDIITYVNVALTSINYVEPTLNASTHISYTQLFERTQNATIRTFSLKHVTTCSVYHCFTIKNNY